MKNLIFLFLLFAFSEISFSQSGEWVWIHGSMSTNVSGSFGVKGVPSPSNVPPGLYEPCEWTDKNGRFWMMGGWGPMGPSLLGTLWMYDQSNNEWTWVN